MSRREATSMEVDIAQIAESKINDLNKRTEKLTQKLLAVESEKQQLQRENKRIHDDFSKLKHELEEADENLENALKALQAANKEIEYLQEKLKESSEGKDLRSADQRQIDNLQKENKKLQAEVNRLSGKLIKSESLSQSYNDKLRERNNSLAKENEDLRNQLRQSHENSQELNRQCTSLTADLSTLRIDLEESNSKASHCQIQIRELENRIRSLTREKLKLKGQEQDYTSSSVAFQPAEYSNLMNEAEEFAKFGKIEKASAEVIAHLFFEEMSPLLGHFRPDQIDDFRIACIRASFCLLKNSKYPEGSSEKEESFIHHLRKKKVLTKLVEEAIVGVKSLEDSSAIKKEILQMQKLLNDLELKIQSRTEQLKEKDKAINALQNHSSECRRQAEDSLTELEVLNTRLQTGREELLKLDSELQLLKREVEISRVNLKESCALTEIESKSIDAARERLASLKYEQSEMETSIQRLKDQYLQEEIKLRSLKSSVSEQVRLFQIDLTKLQQEFKAKHKSLEDVNRRHQIQEEEAVLKQKEMEGKLSLLRRDCDEESHKLSLLRDDFRSLSAEVEDLKSKKRNAEFELKSLQEKLELEKLNSEKFEADYRRRYDGSQHELKENHEKLKQIKDAISVARKDYASINQKIEEQKRNLNDLLRSSEHQRRSLDLEITDMNARLQISTTALSQVQEQVEAKQKLLHLSLSEIRTNERRLDEVRRLVRSEELRLEDVKNSSKSLGSELDSSQRELSLIRSQIDESKLQISSQKAVLSDIYKSIEEKKSQLDQLREDENFSREVTAKADLSATKLNEQVRNLQIELRNLQTSQQKEKQQLKDLQNSKFFLQSEINRLNAELSNGNEYAATKYSQKQDIENTLKRLIDEQSMIQKKILTAKAELDDLKNRQDELRLNEDSLKMAQSRIISELDLARDLKEKEENILAKLKRESRETGNALTKAKQDLSDRIDELQKKQVEMEGLSSSLQNLNSLKVREQEEIKKLREQRENETKRASTVESQVSQLEDRLKSLREEIQKVEEIYENKKSQAWEESKKIELQRRALQQSAAELIEIENNLQQSEKEIQERKQKSVLEIGHLNSLRQSTQQQLMQLIMAKEMVDPISGNGGKLHKIQPSNQTFPSHALGHSTTQKSRGTDLIGPSKKEDINSSFTTISESDQDEVEKLAFSSLQQAVEHLRQQSSLVLQGK